MQKNEVNRNIKFLEPHELVLLRPEIYVGPVAPVEEKVPIIKNGQLINKTKVFSIGMYKILDEALDNAFDEAKRCHSQGTPLKKITVKIDSEENSASIIDDGKGFVNGLKINKKTKVSNVETAFSFLGAGSNFENNEVEVNLIGANGVGISCTNILSDLFEVRTVVGAKLYTHSWEKFQTTEKITKKKKITDKGTSIKFIPRESIFIEQRWDKELLMTKMIFRNFVKNQDERMVDTKLDFYFDNVKIDLTQTFFPEDSLQWSTPTSNIVLWPSYNDSTSVSFVNGTFCSGVHQKMIQEHINEDLFENEIAHRFYEVCTIVNISPKFAKFDTQNKTRLVTRRDELGKIVKLKILKKTVTEFRKTEFYLEIADNVDRFIHRGEVNKLKKKKRSSKIIISDKFLPSKYKENYFIVEGLSAAAGIAQKRNSKTDSIYALKGKIKNVKTITDLSGNKEIMDLIQTLNLNIEDGGRSCYYKKIVIAADQDFDGFHIASLIINFFHKWFPEVIRSGKLYILRTPLLSVGTKNYTYFYEMKDFKLSTVKPINKRYFKGLGSLNLKDWEHVFKHLSLFRVKDDKKAEGHLKMAFGDNPKLRKAWLKK